MGRPPLPVGTWGDITVHPTASGRYEARARYRDYDGITRHARRTGDTPRKAKTALTAAPEEVRQQPVRNEADAQAYLGALQYESHVAEAIRQPGGQEAVQLKVAEKAVDAYSRVAFDAKTTLVVPSNMTEVSALISSAMKMVQANKS